MAAQTASISRPTREIGAALMRTRLSLPPSNRCGSMKTPNFRCLPGPPIRQGSHPRLVFPLVIVLFLAPSTASAVDGSTVNLQFIKESAILYGVSTHPTDSGASMVPLYHDYFDGGQYGSINGVSGNMGLEANDPDAGRGLTSMAVTWSGAGPNAYFQFDIGYSQPNRPRNIPQFGMARKLRLMVKTASPGVQLRTKVYRVDEPSRSFDSTPIADQWHPLTQAWSDIELTLAVPAAPHQLHAVQFELDQAHHPSGGPVTIRIDEVRLITDGHDPLRLAQSYRPVAAGNTRDVIIYPNRAFLYDQALSIEALRSTGLPANLAMARNMADAVVATMQPDGSFYDERKAGHVLNVAYQQQGDQWVEQWVPKTPESWRRTLGDNSWLGIVLLSLHQTTGHTPYLAAARAISDWAELNLKKNDSLKGYTGGHDNSGTPVLWRSTEHCIDYFQLNRRLSVELSSLGEPAAQTYYDRAQHAAHFVLQMYDASNGRFWTGTNPNDTINTSSVPLDAQFWPVLTLARWPELSTSLPWVLPPQWADANLRVTDGPFHGYTFSQHVTPPKVWFEGNGIAAVAHMRIFNQPAAQMALDVLELSRNTGPNAAPQGYGQTTASSDGLNDPHFSQQVYDARLALAPSAWAFFARRGLNPFDPKDVLPPLSSLHISRSPSATVTLTFDAVPASSYQIRHSPDLVHWTDVGNATLEGKLARFSHQPAPTVTRSFYQVIAMPP